MRAIIRWSVDGEKRNQTGNKITKILTDLDAQKLGSASYEVDLTKDAAIDTAIEVLNLLRDPPGGGDMDHIWLYIDRSDRLKTSPVDDDSND